MATDSITLAQFNALSPRRRMEHVQAGGTVTDDPPAPPVKLRPGEVSRQSFDKMTAEERAAVIKGKAPIVDADE